MCHEFLTHPLLVFGLFRLCFQPFVGFTHLILQTARSNTQSGSQCSQYADRDLQNCFPSFFLHFV
ncbi:unknown [Prevotella sp. CAG:604]|nr:unknown [Prevotella sp. CAG:604]